MTSKTYRYDVTPVDSGSCQGATIESFRRSSGENPNVPCKNTARVNVSGITLCPVHAGLLIAYGAIPAATGGVWQDDRRGQ